MATKASTNEAGDTELGALPEWRLEDLYASMDAPEIESDLETATLRSDDIAGRYKGRLADLAQVGGAGLAAAIGEFEEIEEILGKLMSYAGLIYAGDTSDPARAKFYGDLQSRLTPTGRGSTISGWSGLTSSMTI